MDQNGGTGMNRLLTVVKHPLLALAAAKVRPSAELPRVWLL